MGMIPNARFEEMMADVGKIYADADDIVADDDLTRPQKVKLLRQWELDLRENLVATEENMAAAGSPEGRSAELLRSVRKALMALGDVSDRKEASAPNKTGGA